MATTGDFSGTHTYALDAKGRVAVPKPILDPLLRAAGKSRELALTLGTQRCLFLVPRARLALVEKRSRGSLFSAESEADFDRLFYSTLHLCVPDAQGRITIPNHLKSFAEFESEITFLGARDHVELWSTGRWAERMASILRGFDQLAQSEAERRSANGGGPAGGGGKKS